MKLKSGNGFTLLELMIVVGIVGLLAAVAIPKYGDLLEKANLGATLGNLASLRSAVSIYYGSYMGYPGTIDPEFQPRMDEAINGEMPFVKAQYPYGSNSPYGNDVAVGNLEGQIPVSMGKGWFYAGMDGAVYINSISKSLDAKNTSYTVY